MQSSDTSLQIRAVGFIALVCFLLSIPLPARGQSADPRIYVPDVHFGTFILGSAPKTDSFQICNIGGGELVFGNPNDPDVRALIQWLDDLFQVDPADIGRLAAAMLKNAECIWIKVTFTPSRLGPVNTRARIWGSTRTIRDTSNWSANVVKAGPQITGYDWKARWVHRPCTKNPLEFSEGEILLTNAGTEPAVVKTIELIGTDASYFELDTTDSTRSVEPGDVIPPGTGSLRQKVRFKPVDERIYSVVVRLITGNGDTVESSLQGTGIDSHGTISGATFDPTKACPPEQIRNVVIRALPTRPLTVSNIQISGAGASCFAIIFQNIALPFTLKPGDSMVIPVSYCGDGSQGCAAQIAFSGDHSFCDDSTAILDANTFSSAGASELPEDIRVHHRNADDDVEITYTLPAPAQVRVEIFDARGAMVALLLDERSDAGRYGTRWSMAPHASGLYYCRVTAGNRSRSVPILITR